MEDLNQNTSSPENVIPISDIKTVDLEQTIDNSFISNRIEDYERKLKEQEDYNKKLNEKEIESIQEEELNPETAKENIEIIEYHTLSKKIEILHEDIKVCESYKKSLEYEIKKYRENISESKRIEKRIFNLKMNELNLKEETDKIKIENSILKEKNILIVKSLKKFEDKINQLLNKSEIKTRELEVLFNKKEMMESELINLQNIKNLLEEEIKMLNNKHEDLAIDVNKLSLEKMTLEDEIDRNLQNLKEDIEQKLREQDK